MSSVRECGPTTLSGAIWLGGSLNGLFFGYLGMLGLFAAGGAQQRQRILRVKRELTDGLLAGGIERNVHAAVIGPYNYAEVGVDFPASAIRLIQRCLQPVELEMIIFEGKPYYLARDRQSEIRLLSGLGDSDTCFSEMPAYELMQAASRAAGNAAPLESTMLKAYDTYYYDYSHRKPLPIFRVRLADSRHTWLYINPRTALIQARYTNRSRYERWLWQGLHDLDFPFLYWHRPAWDLTVIILSIGGMALCHKFCARLEISPTKRQEEFSSRAKR